MYGVTLFTHTIHAPYFTPFTHTKSPTHHPLTLPHVLLSHSCPLLSSLILSYPLLSSLILSYPLLPSYHTHNTIKADHLVDDLGHGGRDDGTGATTATGHPLPEGQLDYKVRR